jgi:hypothetical protein
MSVETEWIVENRVLGHWFFGEVTADDLRTVNENCDRSMTGASRPVHLLVQFNKAEKISVNFLELRNLYYDKNTRNVGWIALVNPRSGLAHKAIGWTASMLIQMLRLKARSFESVEAAMAFLSEAEPEKSARVL